MKCRTCGELFTEKNPPMIFLDLGLEECVEPPHFCDSACFVKWVFVFAIHRFDEVYVDELLKEAKLI